MHWLNAKLSVRPSNGSGAGVYADEPLSSGELLCMWGGELHTTAELTRLSEAERVHALQVHDDLFLVPHAGLEAADCFNHSCDPNAGLQGQIGLVARRDIGHGEQVCFDYAMSDAAPYDEFECHCGAPQCRGWVRSSDWMLPQLQARYAGFFSPYLALRIAAQGLRNQ